MPVLTLNRITNEAYLDPKEDDDPSIDWVAFALSLKGATLPTLLQACENYNVTVIDERGYPYKHLPSLHTDIPKKYRP